jgi:hypothetical protein
MLTMKTTGDEFNEVWQRVKKETALRNFTQLSEIAGTSQQNISKKKKDGTFPVDWAYKVARQYGLLTEWIMTGEEPMRAGEASAEAGQIAQPKGIIEEWIQDVRAKEGSDGRIIMELSLQVPEFREWFLEKKSKAIYTNEVDAGKKVA